MVSRMAFRFQVAQSAINLALGDRTEQLQQRLDAVVEHYRFQYPNLTMSFAWKDAQSESAVASGSVLGREPTTEDTFLYGSGTKPITAAAIMRLIDQGKVKSDDKIHVYLDPYLKSQGKKSLTDYFGPGILKATVFELINMGAGIRDFEDDYSFDKWVLGNGSKWWDYPYDSMDFSVSPLNIAAAAGDDLMICPAGNCTAYSSTSYEVAGLLLTAVLQPESPWYDFDLGSAVFPDRARVPTASFPPMGRSEGARLSDTLTVPGSSISSDWGAATLYEQDPSILGWTCGNMVSSPTDVARFFYWALADQGEGRLLSDKSREAMMNTTLLTKGWSAGHLHYGAGIMDLSYGYRGSRVYVKGHEGDTYAFLSSQGYVEELQGTYSLAMNIDTGSLQRIGMCYMLETVKQFATGNFSFSLNCKMGAADEEQKVYVV